MMTSRPSSPFTCMFKTILICVVFDILFMIFFPLFSLKWVAISVTQVVIIFLSFSLSYSWLPYGIMLLQITHSLFSLEGWALGTFIGVVLCLIMSRLKAVVQFSGPISIILTTYFGQLAWCLLAGVLTSVKNHDWKFFQLFAMQSLTYGAFTALLAPFIFFLLRNIWLIPSNPFVDET